MHAILTLALLAACGEQGLAPVAGAPQGGDDATTGGGTTSGSGDDGTTDGTSGDTEGDSGTASGNGTGGGDEPAPTPTITRFVALGDAGTGDDKQLRVARAIEQVCAAKGCDFAVYLGDNFYSDGVTSVDDQKFEDVFETPYAALPFTFHVVLGNHDYGGNGGGWDPARTDAQVAYTDRSQKWSMPDQYYSVEDGQVTLLGLDTNALAWERGADQKAWFPGARDAARTRWKFALGHHTFVSNGPHGNAGNWDGGNGGSDFRDFFQAEVCGKVDVYFGGHDHSLQWLESPCAGTEFIVSGAGGKTSRVDGSNAAWFESGQLGFLWVELVDDQFTGVFHDENGNEIYRRTFTRGT